MRTQSASLNSFGILIRMKLFATLLFAGVFMFSVPTNAHAVFPFAGAIVTSFPCTCSPGQYVLVQTLLGPLPLVYYPKKTPTFMFGNLYKPGTFVLGNYLPAGICLMTATPCVALKAGTMTMVGTSL